MIRLRAETHFKSFVVATHVGCREKMWHLLAPPALHLFRLGPFIIEYAARLSAQQAWNNTSGTIVQDVLNRLKPRKELRIL